MFKCNRCGGGHSVHGEPCPPIPTLEEPDLLRGSAPDGMISAVGKLLESEQSKRNALESARILLNALRVHTDWPDEKTINAAIDTWLEDWKEVFDE